ncbi:MAG: glycosyltransferase [Deferrisomatales bacterium]|nr:glycosyltransferase [Deferrisomatales bacterium]
MTPPGRPVDPDLTVVIPTLGRDLLRRVLEALEAGTVWPARVIVVDQGQRPDLGLLLEDVGARSYDTLWVPSGERGRARGVNRGFAHAATRFVALTDDDCVPYPDWVERMADRLRRNEGAIVTGRVEAGEGEVVLSVVTERGETVQRRPGLRFDRLSGGNMGIAKALMERLGGLDEDPCLRTAEDGELGYRALRAGVPILYAPEVAVTHLGWRREAEREEQYRDYARSQGGFFGKYLRRGDAFIALRAAVHLLRALRRWGVGRLRGDAELAANGRAYVLGLLPGIAAGWRSEGPG